MPLPLCLVSDLGACRNNSGFIKEQCQADFCRRLLATRHANLSHAHKPLVLYRETPLQITHIPKAAGASWITEVKRLMRTVGPRYPTGHERCYLFSVAEMPKANHRSVMLRSPRAHVWSQLHQCSKSFSDTAYRAAFEAWVSDLQAPDALPNFKRCMYDPRNLQTRTLTCHGVNNHIDPPKDQLEDDYPPGEQLTVAKRSLLGIADFFHESLCLLKFSIVDLPLHHLASCTCTQSTNTTGRPEEHRQNGSIPPPLPSDDAALMAKVDRLTTLDRHIFRKALSLFFHQVRVLEERRKVHFLCEERLREVQASLTYVAPDLITLYTNS